MKKLVIRLTQSEGLRKPDTFVQAINVGTRKLDEVKHDLNVFFASEGLPYIALIED